MKKLLAVLIHPLSLTLTITIFLIWFSFPSFPKYTLRIESAVSQRPGAIEYYDDLDGNGYNDRIVFTRYSREKTGVTVLFRPNIGLREWDICGDFPFTTAENFISGDYDNNGKKEIYVFSVMNDSLFLYCISDLLNKKPNFFKRQICITRQNSSADQSIVRLVMGGLEDMNGDGLKDLVFAVNLGFSNLPRTVYLYDIKHDQLITGPKNGYHIGALDLVDLNHDNIPEIIVNGYASQNYQDTIAYPVHDLNCWLIVLNNRLQYLFPPYQFPYTGYSSLETHGFLKRNGQYGLYSIYLPPVDSVNQMTCLKFDLKGNIVKTKKIPGLLGSGLHGPYDFSIGTNYCLGIQTINNELIEFDTSFQITRQLNFPIIIDKKDKIDVDNDHHMEYILLDYGKNKMIVFREDLTHPAIIDIPGRMDVKTVVSLRTDPGTAPVICLSSGTTKCFIRYGQNLFYYLRWALYLGLFAGVYLLTMLIGRLQRLRIEARQKTERKITELQLAIVRNQMDPHFTMNAINAVVDAIGREEKEAARENLLHFSQMYRSLVLSADKIKRTLQEEIDFTENYLALERFRFGNRFTYRIEVDPWVDRTVEVPKMVILSPVENAVKHGLLKKEGGGEIVVSVRREENVLVLEITDNGVGRTASAAAEKTSTGRGMAITEQFFGLYHKITGIRVQSEVFDLKDVQGRPAGTKVVVQIPLS